MNVFSSMFGCVIQYHHLHALRKKESQNGSPGRAIWLSVTQLSMELHFCATLYRRAVSKHDYEEKKWLSITKESRFSKLLSKREPFWLSFFSQCVRLKESNHLSASSWFTLSNE